MSANAPAEAATRAVIVLLEPHEFLQAALVGVMRQMHNLKHGRADRYGASPDDAWRYHIEGACGELALAKHLRTYWNGALGNLKAADVGSKFEVRTRSQHTYDLPLHPTDVSDHCYVLITGRAPRMALRGWCWGHEGMLDRWWSDPAGGRPAFFVPRGELHSIATLPRELLG